MVDDRQSAIDRRPAFGGRDEQRTDIGSRWRMGAKTSCFCMTGEASVHKRWLGIFRQLPIGGQAVLGLIVIAILIYVAVHAGPLLIALDLLLWSTLAIGVLQSTGHAGPTFQKLRMDRFLSWLVAPTAIFDFGPNSTNNSSRTATQPPPPSPARGTSGNPTQAPTAAASPKSAPRPEAPINPDNLKASIQKAVAEALLGQRDAAEALASAVVDAFSYRRVQPYVVVIAAGPGSGKTTMLVQLRRTLSSAGMSAGLVNSTDPERAAFQLAEWPVLLVDDVDQLPMSVCDAVSVHIKGHPDGPRLIVLAMKDGIPVKDAETQPEPDSPQLARMFQKIRGLSEARLNALIVPKVPLLPEMINYAIKALTARCSRIGLIFDAGKSDGVIPLIAAPMRDRTYACHPGTWIPSLETIADRQLRAVAADVSVSGKRVALVTEGDEIKFKRVS